MIGLRVTRLTAIVCLSLTCMIVRVPLMAQGPSLPSRDEAAIRAIVQRYVDAREARDPKAIEPLFTGDADQLVSDGTWRRGRDELVRGMLASSARTGGHRSITITAIRLLAPDVALVDGRYRQAGLATGTDRELWTTLLLRRDTTGWRIAAIRNMLPASPVPPPDRARKEPK
jgi:uncharacterized protein (TIGR02246 family)